jgi:hypothetical protein
MKKSATMRIQEDRANNKIQQEQQQEQHQEQQQENQVQEKIRDPKKFALRQEVRAPREKTALRQPRLKKRANSAPARIAHVSWEEK